jgi:hypothetical protein
MFHAARLALTFHFTQRTFVGSVSFLKVAPQVNIQRDGYADHDQRAYTQDQKPPDHPHSRLA